MKRLLSLFAAFIFIFSMLIPYGSVAAQSKDSEVDLNSFDLDEIVVDESLLNGHESFSFVKDDNDINSRLVSLKDFKVGISERFGAVTGNWRYNAKAKVTRVNITLKLNYRKDWLDSWTQLDSVKHSYAGGLGLVEMNEHKWYPKKKGDYRVCASGTITTVKGPYSMTGCSGTIKHDGSITIASIKED